MSKVTRKAQSAVAVPVVQTPVQAPIPQPQAGIVPLLNADQVAKLLGVSPLTVVRMSKVGRLPSLKVGKCWRYRAATIAQWIQSQEQSGVA